MIENERKRKTEREKSRGLIETGERQRGGDGERGGGRERERGERDSERDTGL